MKRIILFKNIKKNQRRSAEKISGNQREKNTFTNN